jgi:hypothetical protein
VLELTSPQWNLHFYRPRQCQKCNRPRNFGHFLVIKIKHFLPRLLRSKISPSIDDDYSMMIWSLWPTKNRYYFYITLADDGQYQRFGDNTTGSLACGAIECEQAAEGPVESSLFAMAVSCRHMSLRIGKYWFYLFVRFIGLTIPTFSQCLIYS